MRGLARPESAASAVASSVIVLYIVSPNHPCGDNRRRDEHALEDQERPEIGLIDIVEGAVYETLGEMDSYFRYMCKQL